MLGRVTLWARPAVFRDVSRSTDRCFGHHRAMMRMRPSEPIVPTSVLVWDPAEVHRWAALNDLGGWWIAGCLSATEAGSRAAVYQTREDQGIAGFFDFSSGAFKHEDFGYAAYGRPVPLSRPVPRQALLADPALNEVFQRIQGKRWLPAAAQRSLANLVSLPPFEALDDPLPDEGEDWVWVPGRPGRDWGPEAAMQRAIADHRPSWQGCLGFSARPEMEVHPPGSDDLMDLWAPGSIGECKLAAGLRALEQLDRYLRLCRSDGKRWRGHLIVADVYTAQLAEAVFERRDVQLWVCGRTKAGYPQLVEVTRANPRPLSN